MTLNNSQAEKPNSFGNSHIITNDVTLRYQSYHFGFPYFNTPRPEDLAEYLANEEAKFKRFDADSNGKLNDTETKQWMFGYV